MFNIFLSKGFGVDILKVVRRRISRRRSSSKSSNNSSKRRKKAWESTRWWECAQAIATTI
jgi:hypothetical protein